MAKAIYSLKVYLFREQFKLTKKEEKGIREICVFTVRVYVKFWFQAASACRAPRNDQLKDLKKYEKLNQLNFALEYAIRRVQENRRTETE
jgi:hypothetical protein